MSLLNILSDIARERGLTDTQSERDSRVDDINSAAKELHDCCDIPEALDEEVFDINVESQQVALPGYVGKVRGHRYFDTRLAIDGDDARNRYNYSNCAENELWYMQWRQKRTSALQRELSNQSVLKFSVPIAEDADVTLQVSGKTDKSHRLMETVTLTAGSLEVITSANWISVESITKLATTKYNITVKDVEDRTVATILNSELLSNYIVYQIADTEGFQLPAETSGVEILFKKKFQPFVNDGDCFHGTDRYDRAIFWKYMETISRKSEDAILFAAKCKAIMRELLTDDEAGKRRKIKFSNKAWFNVPYRSYGNPYGYQS